MRNFNRYHAALLALAVFLCGFAAVFAWSYLSIGALAEAIRGGAGTDIRNLRNALLLALGATLLLGVGATLFVRSLSRRDRLAQRAKKETDDILRTVNQGLFLLDRDLQLSSERSEALEHIFHRQDFERLDFEQLLDGLIPAKTLDDAREYVKLLWGERVNEKLIKSINPLSEIEVRTGKDDTAQFLEFDFNRVHADGQMSRVLVTVNDVTRRVQLARELQESQGQAQAQMELLLRVLHIEPLQLSAFLEESAVTLKMVNAILKEPARDEETFRGKLDGLFRQMHSLKGEAAALELKSIEQRAHGFEESLAELRTRSRLDGNDFLPLVVKLDDLFAHLAQLREVVTRLADLRTSLPQHMLKPSPQNTAPAPAAAGPTGTMVVSALTNPQTNTQTDESASEPVDEHGLETMLTGLTERIAGEQNKQVKLNCSGFEHIPAHYRRAIKDMAIQIVRNSVAHGIETPEERSGQGKHASGTLQMRFVSHGERGYEFICQDDGRGLDAEELKATAIERGFLTAEKAAQLDERRALSLIFVAGFSTRATTDNTAGRGVGMDIVRTLVNDLQGKLGLSTAHGKFLRLRIWLPSDSEAQAA